nr:hypothetical protein [Tanacetum cinerariifolium]
MDEALIPIDDQVKISDSNMRIDPFTKKKESTYQLTQDIIRQYSFYNAILMIVDKGKKKDVVPRKKSSITIDDNIMSDLDEALKLGAKGVVRPEKDKVVADLTPDEKERYKADICSTNILLQGFTPTDDLIENLTKTVALLAQSYKTHLPQTNNQLQPSANTRNQATVQNARLLFRMFKTNTFDDDVDEAPVQDLTLNEDDVFQADQYDAFNSDVDKAPTTQTMFMANLSSADPIYDEAGLSYDSDIIYEVQDHDKYQDVVCEHHEVHEIHNDVQPNYVVDSDVEYMSDSNMISYDHYVKDNAEPVLQKDTLKIAETIKNKMNEKMKDQMCVKKKVKIIPPEYSKGNYLPSFTPKTQLTPKQIFWSDDILKQKAKALKERANDPKQITAVMVYPPDTPTKLVPRVLAKKVK